LRVSKTFEASRKSLVWKEGSIYNQLVTIYISGRLLLLLLLVVVEEKSTGAFSQIMNLTFDVASTEVHVLRT
jgi:hypothetical protein